MSIERFNEYAEAFEEVFASGEWSRLEPYFTEDAVYEIFGGPPFAGVHEGRQAVLDYLKGSVDGFDRRFDSRELETLSMEERDGVVWTEWRIRYKAGDAELCFDGKEAATFEGDRISRLEDHFPPEASKITQTFMEQHGSKLGG